MRVIAIKMLFGDTAKFYGILLGLSFATLLIAQQAAIFVGLMTRTYALLDETPQPDLWVMDPTLLFVDDVKPMQVTALQRVRSVEGVQWAVPIFKSLLMAKLPNGSRQMCDVVGVDDASLIGAPPRMVEGSVEALRQPDTIIIETRGARNRLAQPEDPAKPDGAKRPIGIGEELELNERRAVIAGIAETKPTFQNVPTIYTTYSRAISFAPANRRTLSMVLVKAEPGVDIKDLQRRLAAETELTVLTPNEFAWKTLDFWMKQTGIPINFGIAIVLGFMVGVAISGQMFYNFTLDNLKYFGAMKAMGATTARLLSLVALQGMVAGVLGLGIGLGATALVGLTIPQDRLAFKLTWHIPLIAAGAVVFIVVASSLFSMRRVVKLDPSEVFQG
ncbi:MAG: ABC transporter permease [Phycisphaerales bacterium]